MYLDFGSKLPAATLFALKARWAFLVIAPGLAIAAFIVSRKAGAIASVKFSIACSFTLFVAAQFFAFAAFQPILELSQVATGMK
jgi:hypothetical protein